MTGRVIFGINPHNIHILDHLRGIGHGAHFCDIGDMGPSMTQFNKQEIIAKFAQHPTDTGSPEVQVSLLTKRINHLTEHFKTHKKDHHSRQGLLKMVARRRGLLKYLVGVDHKRYKAVIAELGLRK